MDKNDELVEMILQIRDIAEELLDALVPPPEEELHELALKRSPPERGVASPKRRRSARGTFLPRP